MYTFLDLYRFPSFENLVLLSALSGSLVPISFETSLPTIPLFLFLLSCVDSLSFMEKHFFSGLGSVLFLASSLSSFYFTRFVFLSVLSLLSVL